LLLVTIVLVLVAAVTLLIGIFSDNLALIFLSIGASGAAAVVLAILSTLSRRRGREGAAGGAAAPLGEAAPVAGTPAPPVVGPPPAIATEAPTTVLAAVGGALAIDGYDNLRVNEILPRLDGLGMEQLEAVADHEEANKNRTTILNRIDQLLDELEGAPAAVPTETVAVVEEVAVVADDGFPIPGYDTLSEAQVIALLADLDADQLETVADREEAGPNRDAVLDAIDDRLDVLEGIVPAPAAKKAPAKKAAASKAPAKKAVASKAPAKKAVASKAPAKKAPASRAPAKKATATKAPAKKAPAKKAAAAPVKKAATTAKKSAPVKKATAAKKATKKR
jgi:hypothetical protein